MASYNDRLDANRQVGMEEWIARETAELQCVHDLGGGIPEEDFNTLGRKVLKRVLAEFRPDLFEKEPQAPAGPPWACDKWGSHEHDWLDCPECCSNYEAYLENQPGVVRREDSGNPAPITADELCFYLEHRGAHCPKCGGDEIESDKPLVSDGDESTILCNTRCPTCGYEWVDFYNLQHAEAAEEFTNDPPTGVDHPGGGDPQQAE